ncbi:hypothetical protein ACET3Z_019986 [Daucus carota]
MEEYYVIVAAWYDVRILGPVWPNINPKPSGSSKNKGSRKKAHARHMTGLGMLVLKQLREEKIQSRGLRFLQMYLRSRSGDSLVSS